MGRIERRPTLSSVWQDTQRRITSAERGVARASTKLVTDVSESGITSTGKTLASFEFVLVESGVFEVWAVFTATMSGSGRSVSITAGLDGAAGAQILNFTSTSSQTRQTIPGDNTGTVQIGGFVVRHWNIAAGAHTIDFKATGAGAGANESLSSGQIAYRII